MITKTQLLSTIEHLPENLSIDELIEHLIFIDKVHKGLKDSQEGKVYTKIQAQEKLIKWLK